MRSLRWMSIAVVVDTDVLMGKDHEVMVFESSTDAMKDVVSDAEIDDPDG